MTLLLCRVHIAAAITTPNLQNKKIDQLQYDLQVWECSGIS